ncbi:hypothetical protein XENOCAPTIV_009702 [Xenoophorus captivus]|uniref:Uncharacterized protein n=1 Tax=Xenoophorus captivus TaxID=1517983 RepID=A0ABV0S2K9_9TELE
MGRNQTLVFILVNGFRGNWNKISTVFSCNINMWLEDFTLHEVVVKKYIFALQQFVKTATSGSKLIKALRTPELVHLLLGFPVSGISASISLCAYHLPLSHHASAYLTSLHPQTFTVVFYLFSSLPVPYIPRHLQPLLCPCHLTLVLQPRRCSI